MHPARHRHVVRHRADHPAARHHLPVLGPPAAHHPRRRHPGDQHRRGAEACPPGPDARLAAIRRLLLDETLAPGDRLAGCLVALYGQQPSRIAALRTTDTSCADGATRLKLGADWLDVPEPVAALLRQHLRDRSNMTTAANPASPWLFPGQLAGEHRSYRRLVRVLHQLGIPARASRLAAWRELVREAPPAVLADALGVSPGTAMRHAFLGGADWSGYAARRLAHTSNIGGHE